MMGIIAFPLWFFGIGMLSTIFQVDPSTDYSLLSVLVRFLKAFFRLVLGHCYYGTVNPFTPFKIIELTQLKVNMLN